MRNYFSECLDCITQNVYICTVFSTEQPPNIVKSGEISEY